MAILKIRDLTTNRILTLWVKERHADLEGFNSAASSRK